MSLEVKNITFEYDTSRLCKKHAPGIPVLNNFSGEFPPGQITALTGSNGVGKTTLARIIMGIIRPSVAATSTEADTVAATGIGIAAGTNTGTAGHLFLDGKCIDDWSMAQRGRAIGYVMQNPAKQIFSQTCIEEVEYGLLNCGFQKDKAEEVAEGYLKKFGMIHHRDDFPFALSHGEKQRLVLAAILAMKPQYLILDEPTASLDLDNRKNLGETLRQIAKPSEGSNKAVCMGCGVIVISHDRNFIKEYCDSEIRM